MKNLLLTLLALVLLAGFALAVPSGDISDSAAEVLPEKILVARATGTCVTPKECQRYNK